MPSESYKKFQSMKNKYATSEYLHYGQVALALSESSGIKKDAAKLLGITYGSLKKFIDENPALEQVIMIAKDEVSDMAERLVKTKIQEGDLAAGKFWLQNQAKDRGWSTRTELTGKDGKDLYDGATEDDKQAIIAQFMAASKKSKENTDEPDGPTVN